MATRLDDRDTLISTLRAALLEAVDLYTMQPERRAELLAQGFDESARLRHLRALAEEKP